MTPTSTVTISSDGTTSIREDYRWLTLWSNETDYLGSMFCSSHIIPLSCAPTVHQDLSTDDGGVRLNRSQWWNASRGHNSTGASYIRRLQSCARRRVFIRITPSYPKSCPAIAFDRDEYLPYREAVQWMKDITGLSQGRIGKLLGVVRQTIILWGRGHPISDQNQRRILAVREVLERAHALHPTPGQLKAWLDTPRGADGRTPAGMLEAGEIDRARLLAISVPSRNMPRPPAWMNTPVAPGFPSWKEHRPQSSPPEEEDEAIAALIAAELGEGDEDYGADERND